MFKVFCHNLFYTLVLALFGVVFLFAVFGLFFFSKNDIFIVCILIFMLSMFCLNLWTQSSYVIVQTSNPEKLIDLTKRSMLIRWVLSFVSFRLSRCVCVCHNEKKVLDEWQARQMTPAILQVGSSQHNGKKSTTTARGPYCLSIFAILTKENEKQFTKPTYFTVYLFRNPDRDRSRL